VFVAARRLAFHLPSLWSFRYIQDSKLYYNYLFGFFNLISHLLLKCLVHILISILFLDLFSFAFHQSKSSSHHVWHPSCHLLSHKWHHLGHCFDYGRHIICIFLFNDLSKLTRKRLESLGYDIRFLLISCTISYHVLDSLDHIRTNFFVMLVWDQLFYCWDCFFNEWSKCMPHVLCHLYDQISSFNFLSKMISIKY